MHRLNSTVRISTHSVQLNSENAMDIIAGYDIVLDATDNVATRYLLNDACVLGRKPLVSGSALMVTHFLLIPESFSTADSFLVRGSVNCVQSQLWSVL